MTNYSDPDPYEVLVAAILQAAVRDICYAASGTGRGGNWARQALALDNGAAYWAEAIGIAWPPELAVLDSIVEALRRGEIVWDTRYEQGYRVR